MASFGTRGARLPSGRAARVAAKFQVPRLSFDPVSTLRIILLACTACVWWLAIREWTEFYHEALGVRGLGYDLRYSWLATRLFVHRGNPYSIVGFGYPPSHVLLAWPLAETTFRTAKHVGLYVTVISMWATVMVAAKLSGKRYVGLIAALGVLGLRFAQPTGDEIVLENVDALLALLFVLSLLVASRNRWLGAGALIGLTLAIKPLLFPVLVVFVLARKWKALALTIGLPGALDVVGLFVVKGGFFSSITSVFTRSGPGFDAYNASLASVGRILGLQVDTVSALRGVAVVLTFVATWIAWTRIKPITLRLVTTSGVLLVGYYVAVVPTEDHYMLTLIPLLVSVVVSGSPMRWPTAWLGGAWIMSYGILSPTFLGLSLLDAQAVNRCIGLGLLLVTVFGATLMDRWLPEQVTIAAARPSPGGKGG